MTDEPKQSQVLIKRDGMIAPWGTQGYLRSWNGLKYTLNVGILKSLAFPVALLAGVIAYLSNPPGGEGSKASPELPAPGAVISVPIAEGRILTEKDLVNVIKPKAIDSSPMRGIQVFNLASLTEIPVGSEAKAALESGASNGIVKAKLLAPLLVDNEPIIPEGAVVFGHGKSSEERLFVEFNRAVFPNGESYAIRAQAFDSSDKILGLKGSFVGSKTKKMALGMLFGFMGGMADGLQDTSGSVFEIGRKPSIRDAALSGTAKAALDQSQMNLDQMKNAPDIIEVKQGTEFYLIVDEPKDRKGDQ